MNVISPIARLALASMVALLLTGTASANEPETEVRKKQGHTEQSQDSQDQQSMLDKNDQEEQAKQRDSDAPNEDSSTEQETENRALDFESGSDIMMEPGAPGG